MKPFDFFQIVEQTAIPSGAAGWDNCGVQIAGRRPRIKKVALALDPTLDTIERAIAEGADCILTHHPLLMQPRYLNTVDDHYRIVARLLEERVWLYTAHTSLDANPEGPVGWLARELSLGNTKILEPTHVLEAAVIAFVAGENCSEETIEQWRQLDGVQECRKTDSTVRLVTGTEHVTAVKAAVVNDLGYSPVFLNTADAPKANVLGFGCIGSLPAPLPFVEFTALLADVVERDYWVVSGEPVSTVYKVAYCTGSGSSMADKAFTLGADVFITGDVKYHTALDALGCLIDVGHFSLEEEMMRQFALQLAEQIHTVEFFFLPARDPMRLVTV